MSDMEGRKEKMTPKEVVGLFRKLEKEDSNVKALWELIERFVVPFKGSFFTTKTSENQVEWRKRKIYDSTAVMAAQTLAASMQGNLIPTGIQWFNMRFREEKLNDDHEAVEWIEKTAQAILNALADSNFDLEIAEAFINLVSFGSALVSEEFDSEDKQLVFKTYPQNEATFREDHNGDVDALLRKHSWTVRQIEEKLDVIPEALKEKDYDSDEKFEVIFCIWEREYLENEDDSKPEKPDTAQQIAPLNRPYGYMYVLSEGREKLKEGGYYEMPAFVPRWRKVAGSKWGHSPATVVLSNILTLNELTEQLLEATAKSIEPPIFTTRRGIISDVNLKRRGLTVVKDLNEFKEFVTGARVDVGERRVADLRESIKEAFFVDQLQLKDSPAMTATEANIRYELMQRLLGPTVGRLKNDLFDKLIMRAFNILFREGMLPPIPDILKGKEFDIEYLGPLPRSQRMAESQGLQQWLGFVEQVAQVKPEVRDIPDYDKIIRMIGKQMGAPESVINSDDDVKRDRKKQSESQGAQNAQDIQSGQAMESIGKGTKAMIEAQNAG